MRTAVGRPIEACLLDLFRHLGIEQAHIAAGVAAIADSVSRQTRILCFNLPLPNRSTDLREV